LDQNPTSVFVLNKALAIHCRLISTNDPDIVPLHISNEERLLCCSAMAVIPQSEIGIGSNKKTESLTMKPTPKEVNDFVQTFPEGTKKLVCHFLSDKHGCKFCKENILSFINRNGYNTTAVLGEVETHYKIEELFDAIKIQSKKKTFAQQAVYLVLGDVLLSSACYLLNLDKNTVKTMKKNNPEQYSEISDAVILVGLKAIFA
jgi:hypothetical protein